MLRTIPGLKRYRFMKPQSFGHQFAGLLIGIAIAVLAPNPDAAARQKPNYRSATPSNLVCSRTKVHCPRKASKAAAVKSRAKVNKKPASAKRLAKPANKRQPEKAVASRKNIELVAKPQQKPAVPKPPGMFFPEIVLHVPKPQVSQQENKPSPSVDGSSCRNELTELGAEFSVPAEVKGTGVCHLTDPVQLSSVTTPSGRVELPGTPLLNCTFARQFAIWLSYVAAPVVLGIGEAKLSSISTGTSYQCRLRNGDHSDKMSEHAFGNAIDIAGITLSNRRRIEVAAVSDPQDRDYRLLMVLRTTACGYFTTVLGPGSNLAHATHYHFDLGVHGKSGNYRICE
jgi:hypothetical protein